MKRDKKAIALTAHQIELKKSKVGFVYMKAYEPTLRWKTDLKKRWLKK